MEKTFDLKIKTVILSSLLIILTLLIATPANAKTKIPQKGTTYTGISRVASSKDHTKNKKAYAQFDNAGKNFYEKNIRCATAQSISYNKYIAKRGMRYKYKATIISVKKIKGKKYKVKVKATYVPQKTNNANYSKYSGVYNISLK